MPAASDPRSTVIFEWETGTIDNRKIHVVKLEIPPKTIRIARQKNVQKVITTKGHVHNHGLEGLPVINCTGQAYHPPNAIDEGFNPNSAFAGLEYLNSAYVASGRLSSSPGLTSTIRSSFAFAPPTVANANSLNDVLNTVIQRASTLSQIKQRISPFGELEETGEFTFDPANIDRQLSNTEITSLKNMSLSEMERDPEINVTSKQQATTVINSLTTDNVVSVFAQLNQLAQSEPRLQNVYSKFEYYYNKFQNENSQIAITNLDPTVTTYMTRDPFVFLKADAATNISQSVSAVQEQARQIIRTQEGVGTKDWIITVVMYIQDKVFAGHFENFAMTESADIPGLINWEFTFVAHQSFILKGNNVIPFAQAFDTSLTQIETTPEIFQSRDRFDVLDSILSLSRRIV